MGRETTKTLLQGDIERLQRKKYTVKQMMWVGYCLNSDKNNNEDTAGTKDNVRSHTQADAQTAAKVISTIRA